MQTISLPLSADPMTPLKFSEFSNIEVTIDYTAWMDPIQLISNLVFNILYYVSFCQFESLKPEALTKECIAFTQKSFTIKSNASELPNESSERKVNRDLSLQGVKDYLKNTVTNLPNVSKIVCQAVDTVFDAQAMRKEFENGLPYQISKFSAQMPVCPFASLANTFTSTTNQAVTQFEKASRLQFDSTISDYIEGSPFSVVTEENKQHIKITDLFNTEQPPALAPIVKYAKHFGSESLLKKVPLESVIEVGCNYSPGTTINNKTFIVDANGYLKEKKDSETQKKTFMYVRNS